MADKFSAQWWNDEAQARGNKLFKSDIESLGGVMLATEWSTSPPGAYDYGSVVNFWYSPTVIQAVPGFAAAKLQLGQASPPPGYDPNVPSFSPNFPDWAYFMSPVGYVAPGATAPYQPSLSTVYVAPPPTLPPPVTPPTDNTTTQIPIPPPAPTGTSTSPSSPLPPPQPAGDLPSLSGAIRPGPSSPVGGAGTSTIRVAASPVVQGDPSLIAAQLAGEVSFADRIKMIPKPVLVVAGVLLIALIAAMRSRSTSS